MSEQRTTYNHVQGSMPFPLHGKRVLVTRTRTQAGALSERLRALGALPVEFPTIHIEPPQDWTALDDALGRLLAHATRDGQDAHSAQGHAGYDWVVFTSVNGVTICCERLLALGGSAEALRQSRIAAIGPATAATLERYGLAADLVPEEYVAEGVATALMQEAARRGSSLRGQHILLARAAEARKQLAIDLREAGAVVDEVPAYFTKTVDHDDERGREVLQLLQQQRLDILTFTSSSTVRNFMAWLAACEQHDQAALAQVLRAPVIACIGPITARTARELGLHVTIEAKVFTIDGLLQAIVAFYEGQL